VFLIGVAGGTASGKTTVCDLIYQRLHDDSAVVMLSQDSFYRPLTQEERNSVQEYNFDHPSSFDEEAIIHTLLELKAGRAVTVPEYDFATHSRVEGGGRRVEPADVIIIEGILVLHMERIRSLLNMKVYVDTDDDVRLARRIQRDVAERGRDVAGVIGQYTKFVKPSFDMFVAPSRRHADVIIPWAAGNNIVAIDLITEHIRTKLGQHALRRIYPNLHVVPSNYQIRGMHTIIRDTTTPKNEFVFYADRLIRLVVEAGLGHLPFQEHHVHTPTGAVYCGVRFARQLCGVSIIRSGEAMENALRACCQGVKIGKILVHRHTEGPGSGEQDLIYQKLPSDIAERYVMLMDPILATGNTACKAIKTLMARGVAQDHILFLSIVAAPEGITKICGTYPGVKVITSEIDEALGADYQVVPGVGNFGDRYFCD